MTDQETGLTDTVEEMPPCWTEDGILFLRASALGAHPHSLQATLQGFEQRHPSQRVETAWAKGNELEQVALARLADEGCEVLSTQKECRYQVSGDCVIVGHIDAEVARVDWRSPRSRPFTVEVKSMSPQDFGRFVRWGLEDFPRYRWQVSAYWLALRQAHLLGSPVLFVAMEKAKAGGAEEGAGEQEAGAPAEAVPPPSPLRVSSEPLISPPPAWNLRMARRLLGSDDLFTAEDIAARVSEIRAYPTVTASDCRDPFCRHWHLHDKAEPIEIADARGDLFARRLQIKAEIDSLYRYLRELDGECQSFLRPGQRYTWNGRSVTWPGEGTYREIDTDRLYLDLCNSGFDLSGYVTRKPRVHPIRVGKAPESEGE